MTVTLINNYLRVLACWFNLIFVEVLVHAFSLMSESTGA